MNSRRNAPESPNDASSLASQLSADQRVVVLAFLSADESTKGHIYQRHAGIIDWLHQSLLHYSNNDGNAYRVLQQELRAQLEDDQLDFAQTRVADRYAASAPQSSVPETPEALVQGLDTHEADVLRQHLDSQCTLEGHPDLTFRIEHIGGYTVQNRLRLRKALGMPPPRMERNQPRSSFQPHQVIARPAVTQVPFSGSHQASSPSPSSKWLDSRPPAASVEAISASLPKGSLEAHLYEYIRPLPLADYKAISDALKDHHGVDQNASGGLDAQALMKAAEELKRLQAAWGCDLQAIKTAYSNLQRHFQGHKFEPAPQSEPTLRERFRGLFKGS